MFETLRRILAGVRWAYLINTMLRDVTVGRTSYCLAVFFVSNLGTYIPGGIWHIASRVKLTADAGIPIRTATVVSAIDLLSVILASTILTLPLVMGGLTGFGLSQLYLICGGLLVWPIGLYVLSRWEHPLRELLHSTRHVTKSSHSRPALTLFYSTTISLSGWLASGCALLCVAKAANIIPPLTDVFLLTSLSAASWLAGFMAVWAPGGIGIRETVLGTGLHSFCAFEVAVLIALLSRFAVMGADVLLALISYYWLKCCHASQPAQIHTAGAQESVTR